MKIIYISGPMSGYLNKNYDAFNEAAAKLRMQGYEVLNPAEPPEIDGWEWADYMRRDIVMLMEADTIATLPNWDQSRGAKIEVDLAKNLGMNVIEVISLLKEEMIKVG